MTNPLFTTAPVLSGDALLFEVTDLKQWIYPI